MSDLPFFSLTAFVSKSGNNPTVLLHVRGPGALIWMSGAYLARSGRNNSQQICNPGIVGLIPLPASPSSGKITGFG